MADRVLVRRTADGAALTLRVKPGARRERIVGPHGGALKVEVQAPPERGRANEAVIRLLARAFDLPRDVLEITAGAGGRTKGLRVRGLEPEVVRDLLRRRGVEAAVG